MRIAQTNAKGHYPFVPVTLPYAFDAFEPQISAATMENHYNNIYGDYIYNLNLMLKPYPALHSATLEQLIRNSGMLPDAIKLGIYDNASGSYMHEMFFESIMPQVTTPSDVLSNEITDSFGSMAELRSRTIAIADSVIGSGYITLAKRNTGSLILVTVENESTVLPLNMQPIFVIDLWEHAHINDFDTRPKYIARIFDSIDWNAASARYAYPFDFAKTLTSNN